jgi:hypothetical protein
MYWVSYGINYGQVTASATFSESQREIMINVP